MLFRSVLTNEDGRKIPVPTYPRMCMCVCVCVCERERACEGESFPTDLVNHTGHELWIRLLIGQELPDDLVHDVLRREEVVQELRQDPGHHPRLAGETLTDPGERSVSEARPGMRVWLQMAARAWMRTHPNCVSIPVKQHGHPLHGDDDGLAVGGLGVRVGGATGAGLLLA